MACQCGHAIEEHGHDPKHPGSMACAECGCVAYEEADDEDEVAMIRRGIAPFLECSSKGEVRLSAFFAQIKTRGGFTIEVLYQAFKIFENGETNLGWKQAKGRKAVNQEEAAAFYSKLWDEYIAENPDLLLKIRAASGLSDIFGQEGHCCQATELWRIRNG